jgi:hypothetical protein
MTWQTMSARPNSTELLHAANGTNPVLALPAPGAKATGIKAEAKVGPAG